MRKLFGFTGGHWLFYISTIYFFVAIVGLYHEQEIIWLSPLYVFFLALPLVFPPLGRSMNLKLDWDIKMFDWFKNKDKDPSNVVPFPTPKATPPMPEVKPPAPKEEPAKVFYRLGLTDNNRVAFYMGYSEITMSAGGVQQMIDQLEFFKSQLHEEAEE